MNRDEVLNVLRAHKPILAERFGVAELALFGSFARDQATEGSDVDILVSFQGKTDWRSYCGTQFYLEDLLGRPVDLVMDEALRAELRPYIERDIEQGATDQRSRAWHFYVSDMLEFGEKVLSYTEGMDQAAFIADGLAYDATMRNLELIGEAATHIPRAVREAYSGIPWSAIVGLRNRLAHAYLGIRDDVVWTIIRDAVPKLLPALRELLDTIDEDTT